MVSALALLDGLTAWGIILSATFFGFLSLYEAKKFNIKLLALSSIICITIGLYWLGPALDLLVLSSTGKNITPVYLYGLFSYLWIPFGIIATAYLGGELIFPRYKWYMIAFFAILSLIFEIFIFIDTKNVFIFTLNNPGEDLIDANFNKNHICYFLIILFLISVASLLGLGFAVKSIQSKGVSRKKFFYLSLGYNIFVFCGALDSVIPISIAIGVIRCLMMTFALWMYLGLRVEPEKKEKIKKQKEITIKDDLFRISRIDSQSFTEEQVTFYKEQKICLVCKGNALGYVYVCPKCETLYCEYCARSLEDTENACWYCRVPFNDSKPTKPYIKEETKVERTEEHKK